MAVRGFDILINDINRLIRSERIYIGAINSVLAAQKERIFENGKDSSNSQIGTYSTKPISISKKNQSRNTGKTYFKGGYREYKSLIGKGSEFVNSRNTDQMMMDLGTTISGNEYGIGFSNSFNADKRDWMEEKYGKEIYNTTDEEDDIFINVIQSKID